MLPYGKVLEYTHKRLFTDTSYVIIYFLNWVDIIVQKTTPIPLDNPSTGLDVFPDRVSG